MSPSFDDIEDQIAEMRADLNEWLDNAYAGTEDRCYHGEMDAGYVNWGAIESIAGYVFDRGLIQRLSATSVDSMLFFISRSDECGRIIAWLAPRTGTPFSWCGNLSYPNFLFLSAQALARADDYCDYQLAACFRKRESLDDRAIDLLGRFFQKRDSYTRRMTLHAFEHFAHPQAIDLAETLWETDDCEFAKLSCLHALKVFPQAKPQFDRYVQEYKKTYDVNAEDYRRSHMRTLDSAYDT